MIASVKTKTPSPPTQGYPHKAWDDAKSQAREAMIKTATARDLISYQDLTRKIPSIAFAPHDHSFHHLLGQVSAEGDAAGRGLLSAVVVYKDKTKRYPGDGFWNCAASCGRNVTDKMRCWTEELKRVYNDWAK